MTGPKILVADIERTPGRFSGRYRGLHVEADFWSLSDYQRIIGRIRPDDVLEWPATICAAYRVVGKKRVEFTSVWQHGTEGMHQRLWEAVDAADIAVGHNFKGFDLRHLKTGWRDLGFPPPSPVKVADTLTVARREFGDESRQLAALTKRLGIATKSDKYSVEVARAAVAGDRAAQKRIRSYNEHDVIASEALYLALNPWDSQAAHYGLYARDERDRCRCGKPLGKGNRQGKAYTSLGVYQQYRCDACGRWSRGKKALATVGTR